jgi:hypothetical protein
MKSVFVKTMFAVGMASFLMFGACAKKNGSSSTRAGSAPRGNTDPNLTTLSTTRCSDGSSTWGRILDANSFGSTSFRDGFVDFFSAVMAPENLGDLDGSSSSTTTGVNLQLQMRVENNQLNLSATKLNIEVTDSYAYNKDQGAKVIAINYSKADAGQLSNVVNGAGHINLTFRDTYGSVTLDGDFNGTTATGKVTFANSVHYMSGQTPKSGTLGSFSLKSCGIFY